MRDKIVVMLATEGTYPFHQGGVSTWCDLLVKKIPSVDYVIYSVLMDPFVKQKYALQEQTQLIRMPLWGTEEPSEHLTTPFSHVYAAKRRTDETAVREHFLPLFRELIAEIVAPEKDPYRFAQHLFATHLYFQEYEYKNTFKSESVWDTYKALLLTYTADSAMQMAPPDVYGMIQSLGWVYRFFNILNTPVPEVHVAHSSAAAFCGIPCVLAKMKNKTPYLLTEHGIYIREQYISLPQRGYSDFLNTFLMRLLHSITHVNYALADQISPVCAYNMRWEKKLGVPEERIKVIYNGVDKDAFPEAPCSRLRQPTVVTMARIEPNKDILTLIRTAAIVRETMPAVKFVVYGMVAVPAYYQECLALCKALGLEETFVFAGYTHDLPAAYQSGDVIALSSITEAFPYTVVEAMMSAKPVVSTDVGGIKEALGDAGILVPPGDAHALAQGLLRLLQNPALREAMGRDARARAVEYFNLEKVMELHLKSYLLLALGLQGSERRRVEVGQKRQPSPTRPWQIRTGYACAAAGDWQEAIAHFRSAINAEPGSPSTPILLAQIAKAYERLGEPAKAQMEMEKCNMLLQLYNRPQQLSRTRTEGRSCR